MSKGIKISEYAYDSVCDLLVSLKDLQHERLDFEKLIRMSTYAKAMLREMGKAEKYNDK